MANSVVIKAADAEPNPSSPAHPQHTTPCQLYGAPTAKYGDAFANLTRAMRAFGVGNGFDPLGTDVEDFTAASSLGWPISFSPIQGGNVCFQVPGCDNNMTVEQHARLQILDDANVYSDIQFGEYGCAS